MFVCNHFLISHRSAIHIVMATNERRSRKVVNAPSTEHSGQTSPISTDGLTKDTPSDYLFKNNVTSVITESINSLIMNRPDDPIHFLMNYFASSSCDPVNEAYLKLSWSHFTKKSYQRNLLEVYNTLISVENKSSHLYGLLGDRFNELLRKLSDQLPDQIANACVKKLHARDTQVITFNRFYQAVLLLDVMKDFIKTVEAVYIDLDIGNVGKASDGLCTLILSKLKSNINCHQNKGDNNVTMISDELEQLRISTEEGNRSRIFDGDETLITDLQEMLESASSSASSQPEYMEQEAFVDMAVQIFLDKV